MKQASHQHLGCAPGCSSGGAACTWSSCPPRASKHMQQSHCSQLHRPTTAVPIWSGKALEGIRAACRVGREVLDKAHAAVRPGVTTDEIDRIVHEATVEAGGYPSPLNYYNFPKSVCTSVNEVRSLPSSQGLQPSSAGQPGSVQVVPWARRWATAAHQQRSCTLHGRAHTPLHHHLTQPAVQHPPPAVT